MANMFNADGTYNKTNWKAGDKITANKLNKIEESLEAINNNDISRHVEADTRLDALEEQAAGQNEVTNERIEELNDFVLDTKDELDLEIYDINSRMTFLEEELNEGITEVNNVASTVDGKINAAVTNVNNVASTVDGKIATAEANMTAQVNTAKDEMEAQVNQGKADMEAMVAEVEGELESKANMDDFIALGGVYGTVDDETAYNNGLILQQLIDTKNCIVLDYMNYAKYTLQTLNMSLYINDWTVIKNVRLSNRYTEQREFSIGTNGKSVRNYKFENVVIGNASKDLCLIGLKLGDGASLYGSYGNFDNIEFNTYVHPIVLFTWNTLIGRIKFYECDYVGVFTGTSINIKSLYAIGAKYGIYLGEVPADINPEPTNNYLDYSKIEILSMDKAEDKLVTVANLNALTIDIIASETSGVTKDIIHINGFCDKPAFVINRLFITGDITGSVVVNNFVGSIPSIRINHVESYYLMDKIIDTTSNPVYVFTDYSDSYSRPLPTYSTAINNVKADQIADYSTPFGGNILSYAGTVNPRRTFNTVGNYVGTLNKTEALEIRLSTSYVAIGATDNTNRLTNTFIKMDVTSYAPYQTSTAVGMGTLYIRFVIDAYNVNQEYTPVVVGVNGCETLFNVSIDSSGDQPKLIITPSTMNFTSTTTINYLYNMTVITGRTQSVRLVSTAE